MFKALTKAAALSGGDAFASQTVLFASGPLTQSGYWNPMTPLADRALARANLKDDDGLMVADFLAVLSVVEEAAVEVPRLQYISYILGRQWQPSLTGPAFLCSTGG